MTVICVHGYTSHAEREWAFPGLFYHSLGYNVLIPYQRAHGLSEGKYISFGALESRDMLCWLDSVDEMTPDGQVIFHGLSMGGGIVLDLSDKPMKNVKCMICDAPSMSVADLFDNVAGTFDVIVSNPPYFVNSLLSPDSRRTVARHTTEITFAEAEANLNAGLVKTRWD